MSKVRLQENVHADNHLNIDKYIVQYPGADLTKLEHFAGLAMQGILSSDTKNELTEELITGWAVQQAKSLLEELEKTNE